MVEPANVFRGKTLMITGGTGSFGNAVLRHFLTSDLAEIRIFSRDENKQEAMRIALNHPKLRFYIGDVRNADSINEAMRGVDYVFHAAALKQVPSCEFFPMEAVRTNVLGTEAVLNAALAHNVQRVVVLSTDKAVYPINAMGISKAMMEKLVLAKARAQPAGSTVFCATRYGNVMSSRGSVIPLFLEQLRAGKPLTVTDPAMTRFLMSLEDSVKLVVHAFLTGMQGDIFVQKSPAATVGDLAEAMKMALGKDNPIHIIGARHGEKLYETLVSREEMSKAQDEGPYIRIPADNRGLNYAQYAVEGNVNTVNFADYTSHNTERVGIHAIHELLERAGILTGAAQPRQSTANGNLQ